jgi:hypothetical protein
MIGSKGVHQAEFKVSFALPDGRWFEVESSEGSMSVIDPRLDEVTDWRQVVPEAAMHDISGAAMGFMHACERYLNAKLKSR